MQQRALFSTAAFLAGVFLLLQLSCTGGSEAPASTVQLTAAPTSAAVEPTTSSGVLVVEASAPVAFAFTPDERLFSPNSAQARSGSRRTVAARRQSTLPPAKPSILLAANTPN